MLLSVERSQLVLVDYQARLMPAIFEGDLVLANAMRLAQAAQALAVPALATEENPEGLGPALPALTALCHHTFAKMAFSACADGLGDVLRTAGRPPARMPAPARAPAGNARSLPRHLQQRRVPEAPVADAGDERDQIVIAGCEAHVCLMQTALDLLEEEFEVWVVTDACSSRTVRNRDAAFDRLAGAGCELVSTEMVVFEWLRDARHPQFKRLLALVK